MKVQYVSTKTRLDTAIRNADERGREIAYIELLPIEWNEFLSEMLQQKLFNHDWHSFGMPINELIYQGVQLRKVKDK